MRETLELICSLPDAITTPEEQEHYIEAWKEMAAIATYFQRLFLSKIFEDLFNRDMLQEDLIPTLVELLPNDITLLNKAKEKLKLARDVRLEKTPPELERADLALTNIYAAITFKLENPNFKLPDKNDEALIPKVVNEVRRVEALTKANKDFTNAIMTDLEKIIARYPELHQLYFSNPKRSREDIFEKINDQIIIGAFALKDNVPAMVTFSQKIKQFIALRDIYLTLMSACSAKARAQKLEDKFKIHTLALHPQLDSKPLQFFQDVCGQLNLSCAARFFTLCNDYILQSKAASQEKPRFGIH